jgi:hypothetical protein
MVGGPVFARTRVFGFGADVGRITGVTATTSGLVRVTLERDGVPSLVGCSASLSDHKLKLEEGVPAFCNVGSWVGRITVKVEPYDIFKKFNFFVIEVEIHSLDFV